MFRVKVNGRELAFTFQHKTLPSLAEIRKGVFIKSITTATVDNGRGTTLVGRAMCSALDNFDKDKGRKIALANALKDSGMNYFERAAIWNRYHNRDINDTEYAPWQDDLNGL